MVSIKPKRRSTPKDDTMKIEGADAAIIGYAQRCGEPVVVVYDYQRLVSVFMQGGMDEDEAREWVEYNIIGAWLGKGTPIVMHDTNSCDIEVHED